MRGRPTLLIKTLAVVTLIGSLSAGCADDKDTDVAAGKTTSAGSNSALRSTVKAARTPMSIGNAVDGNSPTAWCDAAKVFNDQQRAALLLQKGQRDEFLRVARANLEVLKANVPAEAKVDLDQYFAAWSSFFDRVERGEQKGTPIPIYDRTLAKQRETWKAEVKKCG